MTSLNLDAVHSSWHPLLEKALSKMDRHYLSALERQADWLPGPEKIFNAFSQPLKQVRYILFGESPYPRAASANGYAFWDAAVETLWSATGFSKPLNRATSLRHFIKMLLVAHRILPSNQLDQSSIAQLDHTHHLQTLDEVFNRMLEKGFLLLNASLVLSKQKVALEAKYWEPFLICLLEHFSSKSISLILFGKIAERLHKHEIVQKFDRIQSEHPYNTSFIHNQNVLQFFSSFNLLLK